MTGNPYDIKCDFSKQQPTELLCYCAKNDFGESKIERMAGIIPKDYIEYFFFLKILMQSESISERLQINIHTKYQWDSVNQDKYDCKQILMATKNGK
jgi:hypothetical protein